MQLLLKSGQRVLLASHTHNAVDAVLAKVIEEDPEVKLLRMGRPTSVHPVVRPYTLAVRAPQTTRDYGELVSQCSLVGVTCLGIGAPLFSMVEFDYCIIDEASQVQQPIALGVVAMARRFVLVGDHMQLPPLVRSREALAMGFDESLFKRLAEAHPAALRVLDAQYCSLRSSVHARRTGH